MTEAGVATAMAMISATYPNAKLSDGTAAMWLDILGDVEDSRALAALREHIAREQWPPVIAQIRKAVYHVDLPTVGDAWAEVERRIKGEDIRFSAEEIYEADRQIGTPRGTVVKNSEMPFIRKRFESVYAEVCERRQEAENIQRLNAPREAARLGENNG